MALWYVRTDDHDPGTISCFPCKHGHAEVPVESPQALRTQHRAPLDAAAFPQGSFDYAIRVVINEAFYTRSIGKANPELISALDWLTEAMLNEFGGDAA